jgi:hypothetical protein
MVMDESTVRRSTLSISQSPTNVYRQRIRPTHDAEVENSFIWCVAVPGERADLGTSWFGLGMGEGLDRAAPLEEMLDWRGRPR